MKDALVILGHGSCSAPATGQFIELVDMVRERWGDPYYRRSWSWLNRGCPRP